MHRDESRSGVDAQILGEHARGLPERRQRVALPVRPVEPQHQLAPERLPVGVLASEIGQFGHDLQVVPEREFALDELLGGSQPQLVQPRGHGRGEGHVGQIGQSSLARPLPEGISPFVGWPCLASSTSCSKRSTSTSAPSSR